MALVQITGLLYFHRPLHALYNLPTAMSESIAVCASSATVLLFCAVGILVSLKYRNALSAAQKAKSTRGEPNLVLGLTTVTLHTIPVVSIEQMAVRSDGPDVQS